jgi:hypothetical protein
MIEVISAVLWCMSKPYLLNDCPAMVIVVFDELRDAMRAAYLLRKRGAKLQRYGRSLFVGK